MSPDLNTGIRDTKAEPIAAQLAIPSSPSLRYIYRTNLDVIWYFYLLHGLSTADAEIKVFSTENPELSKVLFLKPV